MTKRELIEFMRSLFNECDCVDVDINPHETVRMFTQDDVLNRLNDMEIKANIEGDIDERA